MRFPVIFGSKLYKRRDEHPVSEAVPSRMSQSWPWNSQIAVKIKKKKTLLKKRLWHKCFPANFVKFLRTPFLQNTSGRLLLYSEDAACNKCSIEYTFFKFLKNSSETYVGVFFE